MLTYADDARYDALLPAKASEASVAYADVCSVCSRCKQRMLTYADDARYDALLSAKASEASVAACKQVLRQTLAQVLAAQGL